MSWSRLGAALFALTLFGQALPAFGQTGCVPNPNVTAPPFVDGCPLAAAGLNKLANNQRTRLTQAATFYSAPAPLGVDSNNNCTDPTHPCETVQRPFSVLRDQYDTAGYPVIVQLADGAYTPGLTLQGAVPGVLNPGSITLRGNPGNPAAVVLTDLRTPVNLDLGLGSPIFAAFGGIITVDGVQLVASFRAMWAHEGGTIFFKNVIFTTMSTGENQITLSNKATIRVIGDYKITGGAPLCHMASLNGGLLFFKDPANSTPLTVTLTGTPAFPVGFACASFISQVVGIGSLVTYTGAATGPRYSVTQNSLIFTNAAGANFFPGNSAGAAASGGLYQ